MEYNAKTLILEGPNPSSIPEFLLTVYHLTVSVTRNLPSRLALKILNGEKNK
jgi:hypothetical protein